MRETWTAFLIPNFGLAQYRVSGEKPCVFLSRSLIWPGTQSLNELKIYKDIILNNLAMKYFIK